MRGVLADWPEINAPRMTLVGAATNVRSTSSSARQRELRPAPERPPQRTGYRGPGAELDWVEIPPLHGFVLEPTPLPSIVGLILPDMGFCSWRAADAR
jgi:hypothetical protein